jgi:membrane associated rhomboid family serine protease
MAVGMVLILILFIFIFTLIGFNNQNIARRFDFSVGGIIEKRQYDRMITSIFLHVDYLHLLFNLFSFYSFAIHISQGFGSRFLLILFFGSALGGNLLALVIHRNRPKYRAMGASGAVSGIIFASVLIYPQGSIIVFPVPIGMPPWLFAIIFILISIYGIGKQSGTIGHEAHLGGALTGIGITAIIYPWIVKEHLTLTFVIIIPILLFLYFFLKKPGYLKIQNYKKYKKRG